ncbi:hypothetical protein P4O66_015523 [Electrophorus voltai]|uniref:Uncharacterized protein n=1 Tax=Electrophorus voltai TaxID=2609070 RepID=A0AAD8YYD6_9TELE|nr:hypothetical protein P4O66_015523 [Electrophorus voltai]
MASTKVIRMSQALAVYWTRQTDPTFNSPTELLSFWMKPDHTSLKLSHFSKPSSHYDATAISVPFPSLLNWYPVGDLITCYSPPLSPRKHARTPNQTQPRCSTVPASRLSELRAFMHCGFCGLRFRSVRPVLREGSWKAPSPGGIPTHWVCHHVAPNGAHKPRQPPATQSDQTVVRKNSHPHGFQTKP